MDKKTTKDKKIKNVNRGKLLEFEKLTPQPKFNISVAGNELTDRMGSDVVVGDDVFKVQLEKEFDIKAESNGAGEFTIYHALGYFPQIIGTYKVTATNNESNFPIGQRGVIPETRIMLPSGGGGLYDIFEFSIKTLTKQKVIFRIQHLVPAPPLIVISARCQVKFFKQLNT